MNWSTSVPSTVKGPVASSKDARMIFTLVYEYMVLEGVKVKLRTLSKLSALL